MTMLIRPTTGNPRQGDSARDDLEGRAFDSHVLRRLLVYLGPHRARMAFALLCMLVATGLTLSIPYLTKIAIDQYIVPGDIPGLMRIGVWMTLAYLAIYGATVAQRYQLAWVGQRVLYTLRDRMFRHLQALSLGYHDTHITGVTISRVISDVGVINELLSQGLVQIIGDVLILGGIIIVMLTMNPRLALLTFIVMPLMLIATRSFARRARKAYRHSRASLAGVVARFAEDTAGMRVIQAFAQEDEFSRRFNKVNQVNREAQVSALVLSFIFTPTVDFLGTMATAIVLWFGGLAVAGDELTLGVMVAFLAYVTRFFQPIQELSQLYTTMQAAMAGGERVLTVLDSEPEVKDRPDAREMPPIKGDIQFHHVSFAYRGETRVLHDINLTIKAGQTVALVGPTGAGKTSIANLVARFYEATVGSVLIDGIDVRSVTQQSLRGQMGLVPQDPFLFSGTIADNLRFGRPEASLEDVEAAARLANAHEFISALPQGYDTEILEGGVNLSVGQRQLICIGRVFLVDPRIVILDEATSSVDTVTEALIQEALHRLLADRTAIIIAHRLSTIRDADVICVAQAGRIVEQGNHETLLARGGVYRDLFERQFLDEKSGA